MLHVGPRLKAAPRLRSRFRPCELFLKLLPARRLVVARAGAFGMTRSGFSRAAAQSRTPTKTLPALRPVFEVTSRAAPCRSADGRLRDDKVGFHVGLLFLPQPVFQA